MGGNQIIVYLNGDDLNPATAQDPQFDQLLFTNDTARNTGGLNPDQEDDKNVFLPSKVSYYPGLDKAVLNFSSPLDQLRSGPGTYRLRIGTNETVPLTPQNFTPSVEPGSKFGSNPAMGEALDLAGTFDIGPTLEVRGDAGSFADETTFTIIDVNNMRRTFEFDDAGTASVAQGNVAVPYNSSLPTTAADMALAIAAAVNGQTSPTGSATPFAVSATPSGTRIAFNAERNVFLGTSIGTNAPAGLAVGTESVIITSDIASVAPYPFDFPGTEDEIGHREIRPQNHLLTPADTNSAITTFTYTFDQVTTYGNNSNGQPLFNAITEAQKERAREIFQLYGEYGGIDFVEVPRSSLASLWVITGDLVVQGGTSAAGGTLGISFQNRLVMDSLEAWDDIRGASDDPLKTSWQAVAMQVIKELRDR